MTIENLRIWAAVSPHWQHCAGNLEKFLTERLLQKAKSKATPDVQAEIANLIEDFRSLGSKGFEEPVKPAMPRLHSMSGTPQSEKA